MKKHPLLRPRSSFKVYTRKAGLASVNVPRRTSRSTPLRRKGCGINHVSIL